jgi:hypothetical protein
LSRLKSCESACASVAEPLIRLRALRELQVIESGVISGKREGTFLHTCIKFDELNGIERDVISGKREEMGYPFIKSMLSSLKKRT